MTENWDNFDTPQEKAERQAREKREEQARIEERAKNEQRDFIAHSRLHRNGSRSASRRTR